MLWGGGKDFRVGPAPLTLVSLGRSPQIPSRGYMEQAAAVGSAIIALLSLVISLAAYWHTRPVAVQERERRVALEAVAGRALILADQIQTVITIGNRLPPDSYLLESLRRNGNRLEDALDLAAGKGLLNVIAGVEPGGLVFHVAMIQSLVNASRVGGAPSDWSAEHLLLGLISLLERLEAHPHTNEIVRRFAPPSYRQLQTATRERRQNALRTELGAAERSTSPAPRRENLQMMQLRAKRVT
jgi:hypothetical protein